VLKPALAVAVLGLAASGALLAGEPPGLAAGSQAPALRGRAWLTADGKAPDLTGKAYLVYFWYEG
jgi:hypothetical protein